ncbi:MAG: hypothetical protein U5J64_07460 [Halobacteriales archaeon]|nr:hypothetical protein [Halobacteriales archaeon]
MPANRFGFQSASADFVPGVVSVILLVLLVAENTAFEVSEVSTAELAVVVVVGGYVAGRFFRAVSGTAERLVERVFEPKYDYSAIYEEAKSRSVPHIDVSDAGRVEGFAQRLAHEESDAYVGLSTAYRYSRNILTVVAVYGFVFVLSPLFVGLSLYGFSVSLVGVVFLLVSVFLLYRTRVLYHRKKRALEDGFYMGLSKMEANV